MAAVNFLIDFFRLFKNEGFDTNSHKNNWKKSKMLLMYTSHCIQLNALVLFHIQVLIVFEQRCFESRDFLLDMSGSE